MKIKLPPRKKKVGGYFEYFPVWNWDNADSSLRYGHYVKTFGGHWIDGRIYAFRDDLP